MGLVRPGLPSILSGTGSETETNLNKHLGSWVVYNIQGWFKAGFGFGLYVGGLV